jgi:hypothetical protein
VDCLRCARGLGVLAMEFAEDWVSLAWNEWIFLLILGKAREGSLVVF